MALVCRPRIQRVYFVVETLASLQAEITQAQRTLAGLEPKPLSASPLSFEHRLWAQSTLSGDALDYFQLNDELSAFYVADVAGSGVDAALVVVWLKPCCKGLNIKWAGRMQVCWRNP